MRAAPGQRQHGRGSRWGPPLPPRGRPPHSVPHTGLPMLTAVPKGKSPREIWPWLASQAPLGGCTDKPGIPEGAGCHLSLRTARPRGPAWRRPPSFLGSCPPGPGWDPHPRLLRAGPTSFQAASLTKCSRCFSPTSPSFFPRKPWFPFSPGTAPTPCCLTVALSLPRSPAFLSDVEGKPLQV